MACFLFCLPEAYLEFGSEAHSRQVVVETGGIPWRGDFNGGENPSQLAGAESVGGGH